MDYMQFTERILLSLVLGTAIGLERQLTGHIAGIRINVLICMGTCFFTLFPLLYGSDQVFRVGSSLISGVSFLCSGVIFKENGSVRGINTAATLWCSAAIGILASTNAFVPAVIAASVLIISNLVLRPLAKKIHPLSMMDETENEYRISVTCYEYAEPEIRNLLINDHNCQSLFLTNLESGDYAGNKVEVSAEFCSFGKSKHHMLEEIVRKALAHPAVTCAGWEIL